MDGVHDLGGMEGFGPVEVEPDEPVFHTEWERRACGVTFGTFVAGMSNGGQFRHSIERMDAAHYLTSSYYEHWLTGVATRAVELGVVDAEDLAKRAGGSFPLSRPVVGDSTAAPTARHDGSGGRSPFAVGDEVRVKDVTTRGHTRCPRYVRRRRGVIVRIDPAASLPDVEAHSDERVEELIYSVAFDGRELWGPTAEAAIVHVDLWQSYLEAV